MCVCVCVWDCVGKSGEVGFAVYIGFDDSNKNKGCYQNQPLFSHKKVWFKYLYFYCYINSLINALDSFKTIHRIQFCFENIYSPKQEKNKTPNFVQWTGRIFSDEAAQILLVSFWDVETFGFTSVQCCRGNFVRGAENIKKEIVQQQHLFLHKYRFYDDYMISRHLWHQSEMWFKLSFTFILFVVELN